MAVLEALSAVPMGPPVLVFSDSEYVIKGTTVWARGWIKNGWLTADGKPVKNKDLWLKLIALHQLHDVQFQHVKGHAGHQYNELCDQLCTEAMAQATKDMLAGQQIMLDDGGPKAVYDARN